MLNKYGNPIQSPIQYWHSDQSHKQVSILNTKCELVLKKVINSETRTLKEYESHYIKVSSHVKNEYKAYIQIIYFVIINYFAIHYKVWKTNQTSIKSQ